MLTLPQLRRRVAGRRVESAKYVRTVAQKRGYDSLGRGYVAAASYSTKIWDQSKRKYVKNTTGPGNKPARYVTVFVFLDTRLHVIVSCSCPDHLYRWEVALNHKEAAEIEYSNGELPIKTNPSMRATFCKHCISLFDRIAPDLPKPKHEKSNPIGKPEVQVPPSKRPKPVIKPVTIKPIQNVQRNVKPGKKQSTAPRPKPAPVPPPAKITPTKVTKTQTKPQPAKMTSKPPLKQTQMPAKPAPAMMRAPKASPPKSPPAMMTPRRS